MNWAHAGPSIVASFLASLVECVEALTVVLAVGSVRGWKSALAGAGTALVIILVLIATLGHLLTRIPIHVLQLVVGVLLLLFGLRWLRKAILRAAGVLPLHDEEVAFAAESAALRKLARPARGWDRVAVATAFQVTAVEGLEVAFIVIAIGAGGPGLLLPASVGALAALAVVVLLGLALHRPVSAIPENTLKLLVGVLVCAFGTFWAGEGMGLQWPTADMSLLALDAGFLLAALALVWACRSRTRRAAAPLDLAS